MIADLLCYTYSGTRSANLNPHSSLRKFSMQSRTLQSGCVSHPLPTRPVLRLAAKHCRLAQLHVSHALPLGLCTIRTQRSQTFTHSRKLRIPVAAAGAAAFDLPSQQEIRQKAANRIKSHVPKPAQLPPPPKSTSLWDVLPYLTKLAVSDAQLYWRLGLAFVLMIASKAAGMADASD